LLVHQGLQAFELWQLLYLALFDFVKVCHLQILHEEFCIPYRTYFEFQSLAWFRHQGVF
jgi:hypothetical protein